MKGAFQGAAKKILEQGGDPQEILAIALAALAGLQRFPAERSLLTQIKGMVTLKMAEIPGSSVHIDTNMVVGKIAEHYSPDIAASIGKTRVYQDPDTGSASAVFDVPVTFKRQLLD